MAATSFVSSLHPKGTVRALNTQNHAVSVGRVRRGVLRRNPTFAPNYVGLRDKAANPTYGYLVKNGIFNNAINAVGKIGHFSNKVKIYRPKDIDIFNYVIYDGRIRCATMTHRGCHES